jgi:hypothetical protein
MSVLQNWHLELMKEKINLGVRVASLLIEDLLFLYLRKKFAKMFVVSGTFCTLFLLKAKINFAQMSAKT